MLGPVSGPGSGSGLGSGSGSGSGSGLGCLLFLNFVSFCRHSRMTVIYGAISQKN